MRWSGLPGPAIARAGPASCTAILPRAADAPGHGLVIEFAPQSCARIADLWPEPGDDFAMMGKSQAHARSGCSAEPCQTLWPHLT